jgi:tripartite-type tricarboxylate transporter receptor subunit TctC
MKPLFAALAAATALAAAVPAQAQSWPTRAVTIVVPFPAGGGTDAYARPLAARLSQQAGQQFVIENKGGAGGTIGASAAARATPDGYTFFMGAAHHAIAPGIYPKLDYDLETDFLPVSLVAAPPQVIVVNPQKVQARTLADLVKAAKAAPGKLNYGSAGTGTTHHLAGELFKLQTGTDIAHIPYSGAGPALRDLLGGQVDMMFDGLGSSAAHIQSGRIIPLAVAATQRSPAFPDLPTAAEAGVPGYVVSTWYALFAPKGTPPAAIAGLQKELAAAFASAELKDIWAKNGSDVPAVDSLALARLVGAEVRAWGEVVRKANVKLD